MSASSAREKPAYVVERKCPACGELFTLRRDLAARAQAAGREPTCSNRCRGIYVRRRCGDTKIAPNVHDLWLRTAYGHAYNTAAVNARRNPATQEIEFRLSHDEFNALVARCQNRCEVTGIPFSDGEASPVHGRRPWPPSLDRIRSDQPFCIENCRIVCAAVNNAMGPWGVAELRELAAAYVAWHDNR